MNKEKMITEPSPDHTSSPIPMNGKKFAPYNHPVYAHEYGHYLQSQNSGSGYLFLYAIPSLIDYTLNSSKIVNYNGINDVSKHHVFWAEIDADAKAAQYFIKQGRFSIWPYEDNYPTY